MQAEHILWITFVGMLKHSKLLRSLRRHIDLFRYGPIFGKEYYLLFQSLFSYWDTYEEIPSCEIFKTLLHLTVNEFPDICEGVNIDILINAIERAYTISESEINPDFVLTNFKLWFMREKARYDAPQLAQVSAEHLPQYIEGMSRSIQMLSGAGCAEFVIPDMALLLQENMAIKTDPLGFYIFDYFTDGFAPGDVNVLLGPFGGGKTTLAIQCVVDAAQYAYRTTDDRRLHVFVGYECDYREATQRAWAAAAWIRRDRLVAIQTGQEKPTTSNNLLPYEVEVYRRLGVTDPAKMGGEHERIQYCNEFMSQMVAFLDFTGSSIGPSGRSQMKGYGGVDEIADSLAQLTDMSGKGVRLVVIDWAGLLVDRYLAMQGVKDVDKQRVRKLTYLVDEIMQKIAQPYQCVVWVTHQLRGQVAKKAPTFRVTLGDAEGCSTFHANAMFGLVIGPQDRFSKASMIYGDKYRRSIPKNPICCQMLGEFNRMEINNSLEADTAVQRIISKEIRYRSLLNRPDEPSEDHDDEQIW